MLIGVFLFVISKSAVLETLNDSLRSLSSVCVLHRSLNMLQKEGRSFSVIFRTFGTETHEVKEGFNTFRKGQHPFAPNVHNTLPRYHSGIIKFPHQMGCFKRSDGRTQLLIGTIDNRNSKSSDGPLKVIEGSREIHTFLQSQSLEGINYALRDDYLYWASKAEASGT